MLEAGTPIEARCGGKTRWYKGKIARVNSDGTYDVVYSDGDLHPIRRKERGVRKHLIRTVDASDADDLARNGDAWGTGGAWQDRYLDWTRRVRAFNVGARAPAASAAAERHTPRGR